jgi:nucleoside-diphosphate-sugar epimerase
MLDCTRADHILGWTPTTSFAEGLRQTVRYFRNQARLRRMRAVTV